MNMDIGTIHSIWTVIVAVIFVGIVFWAWNGKRKKTFDQASMIPLDDDDSGIADEKSEGGEHA